MPVSIPANTACEPATTVDPVLATCERIIRERIPNLLRLSPNPFVAQACRCLTQMIADAWPNRSESSGWQVFLANSGDEALSGAVKLARYAANREDRSSHGVLLDRDELYPHFAATELRDGQRIVYIPDLAVQPDVAQLVNDLRARPSSTPGFIVMPLDSLQSVIGEELQSELLQIPRLRRPTLIACVGQGGTLREDPQIDAGADSLVPDIVVFDETLVRGEVPFGAFAASPQLFRHWRKRGMTTFHSTTFQPNTIASLHLLNCLRETHPQLLRRHAAELARLEADVDECLRMIGDVYSPTLARLIRITGFGRANVRAAGHYVTVGERRVFDAVAGVACSIRGHNPEAYVTELEQTDDLPACRAELRERLHELTALPHFTHAVSGASAVEAALKLGLASQMPRNWILALRGGFGGKTLFALTGTWKSSLKAGLDPLYPHVVYVDPFAVDATPRIEAMFGRFPIGIVQLELVQGVGGVRAVPDHVLDCLQSMRHRYDTLLFVDEVQTGMWRTGPFVRSADRGLEPDLLTLGKGTSDMMFPSALTLHSDRVHKRLVERGCDLVPTLGSRSDFDHSARTTLNVLRWGAAANLAESVARRGRLFSELLRGELAGCRNVREVRAYGLLIGIELRVPNRWIRRAFPQMVLLSLLRQREFPVLAGFCQYEPHVLKLTPPLTVSESELRKMSATLGDVLRRHWLITLWSGARRLTGESTGRLRRRNLGGNQT